MLHLLRTPGTVLMCYENYWNAVALAVIVPALIAGWYAVRAKVMAISAARIGITGDYPVVADTPMMDEHRRKPGRPGSD